MPAPDAGVLDDDRLVEDVLHRRPRAGCGDRRARVLLQQRVAGEQVQQGRPELLFRPGDSSRRVRIKAR